MVTKEVQGKQCAGEFNTNVEDLFYFLLVQMETFSYSSQS